MAVLKEITWTDPRVRTHRNEVAHCERRIERTKSNIIDWENELNKAVDVLEEVKQFVMANVAGDLVTDEVCDMLMRGVEDPARRVREYKDRITLLHRDLELNYEAINRSQEVLERLGDGVTVFTKQSVKEQLADLPSINDKTICVGENDNYGPFVRWSFEGLMMRPDENNMQNINFGDDVAIPLEPLTVTCFLNDNNCTIVPKRGGKRFRGYGDNMVAHPHILDGNRPCLGDFAGPFTEAMDDKDFATVAVILESFLSQAAVNDAAGSHWYKWIDADITSYTSSRILDPRALIAGDSRGYRDKETHEIVRIEDAFYYKDGAIVVEPYTSYDGFLALREQYRAA